MVKRWILRIYTKLLFWIALNVRPQKKGLIHNLQYTQKRLVKDAERTYARTRPPKNVTIDYLGVRLIEVFEATGFRYLKKNLISLFPDLKGRTFSQEFESFFDQFTSSLSSGGWKKIGLIVPQGSRIIPTIPMFHTNKLPEGLSYIEISLHKLLPSLLLVTMDAYFDESVSKHLRKMQSSRYIPEVAFEHFLPKRGHFAQVRQLPSNKMQKEIGDYLDSIRQKIEKFARAHMRGYFLRNWNRPRNATKLPAIELFSLQGLETNNKEKIFGSLETSRLWLESLGFNSLHRSYFEGALFFTDFERGTEQLNKIERFLVLSDQYQHGINLDMYQNQLRTAIWREMQYELDSLIELYSLRKYFLSVLEDFEQNRLVVNQVARFEDSKEKRLLKKMRSYEFLLNQMTTFDKADLETTDALTHIQRQAENLERYSYISLAGGKREGNLLSHYLGSLRMLRSILKRHFNLLERSFSNHITLVHQRETYKLQRRVLLISVMAIVFSLLGSVLGYLFTLEDLLMFFGM